MQLFLHLVDEVIPRNLELLFNDIAHGHQVFQAFLENRVNTDAV
jgi:hypothetical protein